MTGEERIGYDRAGGEFLNINLYNLVDCYLHYVLFSNVTKTDMMA